MTRRDPQAGTSLIELVIASGIVAGAIFGAVTATVLGMRQVNEARQTGAAALGAHRAIQMISTVKFRGDSSADVTEWLFRGQYEIARAANGTTVLMPDLRTAATGSDDKGIGGCVTADFPVPGLAPPSGRSQPGRMYFYVNETTMPANGTNTAFPFPRTTTPTALAKLDCDGDGALTTADLRVKYSNQSQPCRLMPCKVQVQWLGPTGRTEEYNEFVLLGFQGVR